ncbi:50S ribosomal protein L35 [Candidatus Curtissbacteria bacterium RIFCSPHIGHO2_01_FULL_41_11]|uniref:Large ribosomal subunit protein bL35 n=1 Tax=Candidatus Curtissbacteria bacterium RIFCSPHIGHO2_01_FULL_41_11 TaxID=1797711 RepID=A0A1F5G8C8_9BACT|nr:MAG: 50S ribosomal protein L35 [Candidatus Curtissbacteria bacterium RIFCSPHIGHO2_01_FULL_41_11]
MKAKTKKAAIKRFRITKKGKILRQRQMAGHLKANKTRSAKNRYKSPAQIAKADLKNIERLMPYN